MWSPNGTTDSARKIPAFVFQYISIPSAKQGHSRYTLGVAAAYAWGTSTARVYAESMCPRNGACDRIRGVLFFQRRGPSSPFLVSHHGIVSFVSSLESRLSRRPNFTTRSAGTWTMDMQCESRPGEGPGEGPAGRDGRECGEDIEGVNRRPAGRTERC